MKRQAFIDIYLSHLPTSASKREAWEKAEAEWLKLTGSNKYRTYYIFCVARSQLKELRGNWVDPNPGIKAKAEFGEFLEVYLKHLPYVEFYGEAYELAESWHIGQYGARRYGSFNSFNNAQTIYYERKAS